MTSFLAPIHKDGYKFVGIFAIIALFLYIISPLLGIIGLTLTLWCAYFFRNPMRVTPLDSTLLICPSDGVVSLIQEVSPPFEYDMGTEKRWRVSMFLNVFDVHLQRIPLSGTVEKIIYHPGKFLNASLDKASDENERQTVIVNHDGIKIAFTQIAGLIARRIVCEIKQGQRVTAGQLYGLIRFGSRVDIYLPVGIVPKVLIGQRMIGGETVIADLSPVLTRSSENSATS